jgi:hypothetical protein
MGATQRIFIVGTVINGQRPTVYISTTDTFTPVGTLTPVDGSEIHSICQAITFHSLYSGLIPRI